MNGTVLLWFGLLVAIVEIGGLWMKHLARTEYVEIHEGIIRAFRAPLWRRRTATALIVAGPVLALIGAALALVIGS